MSSKKQYLIAGLILLVGIVVSAAILLPTFLKKNKDLPVETTEATVTTEALAEYVVTFYDASGNVMQKSTVKDGETVLPPKLHSKTLRC